MNTDMLATHTADAVFIVKDDCSYIQAVKHLEWVTTQFTEGSLNGVLSASVVLCLLTVSSVVGSWQRCAIYKLISEVTDKNMCRPIGGRNSHQQKQWLDQKMYNAGEAGP